MYSEEDCINAIEEVAELKDESLTMKQYRESETKPSLDTILEKFGTWNEAKKAAELPINEINNKVRDNPESVDLPDDKDWEELSPYQRYYYKNRESEINRTRKRTKELKQWFKNYKKSLECEKCGEDHHACLDFHHEEEKDFSVSEMISRNNFSRNRIRNEIEKCSVLCSNCHRKAHADD